MVNLFLQQLQQRLLVVFSHYFYVLLAQSLGPYRIKIIALKEMIAIIMVTGVLTITTMRLIFENKIKEFEVESNTLKSNLLKSYKKYHVTSQLLTSV
jgi:hypothetical protein